MPRKRKASSPYNSQPAEIIAVLPMELQVSDRLTEATGEWEVVAARPHTTVGGKMVHVKVRKVGEPHITEQRRLAAHEHVAVRRG